MSYEYLNAIIKIGLNAKNNWELLDESNNNDLWFHLDNYPSCYVIVSINKNKKYIDSIINYACKLCYVYSKKKVPESKKAVCVCYTKCKNVIKGKTVGEAILLKKPKRIIYNIEEM